MTKAPTQRQPPGCARRPAPGQGTSRRSTCLPPPARSRSQTTPRTGLLASLLLAWLLTLAKAVGQDAAEAQAFNAAKAAFADLAYERAERLFGEYARQFPQATNLAEAILLQAQARYQLGRFDAAVELLNSRLADAGALADEYLFWAAEAHWRRGDYAAAEAGYARLLQEHPQSKHRLEAAYGQAFARFRQGNVTGTVDLLRDPNGVFQQAAQAQPDDPWIARGHLLLAEALFAQKDFPATAQALQLLSGRPLPEDLTWRRQFLLTRATLAQNDLTNALQIATNLVSLTTNPVRQARSRTLHAEILERLGQPAAAIAVYERNLDDAVPANDRRDALLKIIELSLAQNQVTAGIQRLESFLELHPQDPSVDLARLSLGELQLQAYFQLQAEAARTGTTTNLTAQTNLVQRALSQFETLIGSFPESALVGKAYLDKGWCLWEQQKVPEAAAAFKEAADRLPPSEDQATARFKWAECQLRQNDAGGAVTNLTAVVELAATLPSLKTNLVEQALVSLVEAHLARKELPAARAALDRLLADYPQSPSAERSLLRVGQALSDAGQTAEARQLLAEFPKRFPQSVLLPEVALAEARTFAREGKWAEAITGYSAWLDRFTNHLARAQVEFDRAWLYDRAGQATNALHALTNFVARFARHPSAPLAQYWVGNYYFERGDYPTAEFNFQLLYGNTNWPPSELHDQARLMAGRAAVARQGFKDARDYFLSVATNNTAPHLRAQAWLFVGDTFTEVPAAASGDALKQSFGEAINAFSRLTNSFPNDPLVPLAIGRIGDCHFQLASQEPERYAAAADNYRLVIDSRSADVATRSQAEIGLAKVFEAQARARPPAEQGPLLDKATDHCLNVLHGKNLRDGETADPFWLREAGLLAAKIFKSQQRWDQARKTYERLRELLPALAPTWDRELEQLARQTAAAPAAGRQ